MDLRPINPFYREVRMRSVRTLSLPNSEESYYYPYLWIEPVIDRASADVEYVLSFASMKWENMTDSQKEEYLAGLKGCMNYHDFLRIENNVQILLDVLEIDSESYVEAVPEFLTESYFEKLCENIGLIRDAFSVHADTPLVPELPYNTWQKYNAIEKILADVYEVVSSQFHYYAGDEIYTGDETGLLL